MSRVLRRCIAVGLVIGLGAANFATEIGYMANAARPAWAVMLARLHGLAALPPHVRVEICMEDYPTANLVALYTRGHPTWNLGYLGYLGDSEETSTGKRVTEPFPPGIQGLIDRLTPSNREIEFELGANGLKHRFRRFELPVGIPSSTGYVVLPARDESVVNGSQSRPDDGRLYAAPRADQRDTLVEMDTDLGHVILPGLTGDVGLWQREDDFAGSPGGIQGIGRHVLFEVLSPVPGSRFLVDFTSGGLAGQGIALPSAAVVGTERRELGFAGRGAGRVLSEPIAPREIDGHFYIALDLGMDAGRFRSERHGLAALYNSRLGFDPRHLVGFARNISLLTPDMVAALEPPSAVASVPAGLLTPGLLFSGVAEDGWMADKAWFVLASPNVSDQLQIKGDVPGFSPQILQGVAKVFVDGVEVVDEALKGGAFDVVTPIPASAGSRRIDFEITGTDRLPPPDGRLVSIHLTSLSLGRRGDAGPASSPGSRQ